MKYRFVLFDLDGTLLDTTQSVMESAEHAIHEMGYPQLDYETMLKFVGPPIQDSFIRNYGCDKDTAQTAANHFRRYYIDHALFKAVPYDGIFQVFDAIKASRRLLAVATYKREDYAITILKHFGFADYCQVMHGGDNENKLKKPDIIRKCVQEMGATPEECLYIGDTLPDAEASAAIGMDFLAVTYGFGFKHGDSTAELTNCIGICDTPSEILNYL